MIADIRNVACDQNGQGEYASEAPRRPAVLDQAGEGGLHVMASPGRGEVSRLSRRNR